VRIVLTAQGTRGDVQPFILLGAELQRRGHDVLLVGPPSFEDQSRRAGLAFHGMGAAYEVYYASQAIGDRVNAAAFGATRQALNELEQEAFGTLPGLADGADLVLATGVATASRSAAEAAGADYRFIAQCVRVIPSEYHAPVFVTANTWPRLLNRMTWKPFQGAAKPGDTWNARREALGLPRVARGYAHMLGAPQQPVLAADAALAPLPPDLAGSVVQTCAIQSSSDEPLPAEVAAFLAAGDAPVYIGFGSLPRSKDPAFVRDVVSGLMARGHRVIVGGSGADVAEAAGSEGVLAVASVPHPALFPHVSAVVHHGGAGVTQAAARAGAPQIVVPFMLDQHYWAWRVVETGVGLAMPRARVGGRRLGDAIERVTGPATVQARARLVSEQARGRDGARETADAVLNAAEGSGAAVA
jgi:vancomycin aglycone glucosyltransferase